MKVVATVSKGERKIRGHEGRNVQQQYGTHTDGCLGFQGGSKYGHKVRAVLDKRKEYHIILGKLYRES